MSAYGDAAAPAVTQPHPSPALDATFRPARALIGWMSPEEAESVLAVGHDGGAPPRLLERARKARLHASMREEAAGASVAVGDPPSGIGDHLAAFRPTASDLFSQGWRLCSVHLDQLVAVQQVTFADHYGESVAKLEIDDANAIARITLPLPRQMPLNLQVDAARHAYLISCSDPHLQVVEEVQAAEPTGPVFGFRIGGANSILKVARYADRCFCFDGHHRAYQLLRRNITCAPGLVKDFNPFTELALRPGIFKESICTGDHPPLVSALLDPQVSLDVLAPATRKLIVVEARELVVPV